MLNQHLIRLAARLALLVTLPLVLPAPQPSVADTDAPHGNRCVDVGPAAYADATFCGCTWGNIYVDGQAIKGATVSIQVAGGITQTLSNAFYLGDPEPYFSLHADSLGARYGDTATLTASYAGKTLTRTTRLTPLPSGPDQGEQRANVVFPATHAWGALTDTTGVRSMVIYSGSLWLGTTSGLIGVDLQSGLGVTHAVPLTSVLALHVLSDTLWVAGSGGVARLTPSGFQTMTLPLSASLVTALSSGADGALYAALRAFDGGGVLRYDGVQWTTLGGDPNGLFEDDFTALAVDAQGHVWVGSATRGVSRFNGASWQQLKAADGVASDAVLALVADADSVWTGGVAQTTPQGQRGGVSRYVLSSETWQRFTTSDALADNTVYAIAISGGERWFATPSGLSRFDGLNWWTHGVARGRRGDDALRVLSAGNSVFVAAAAGAVDHYRPFTASTPPSITALSVPTRTQLSSAQLTLGAQATAPGPGRIVVWEWHSSLDGLLGSEQTLVLRPGALRAGHHEISVRAQTADGQWSMVMTQTLRIAETKRGYVPVIKVQG